MRGWAIAILLKTIERLLPPGVTFEFKLVDQREESGAKP